MDEYEDDALTIYRFAPLLLDCTDMSPSLSDVTATVVYQHGRELAERMPAREPREDPFEDPFTFVEEMLERRDMEPPPRDAKWRKPFLLCLVYRSILWNLQQAWERQLSYLVFPIKTEGEYGDARLYLRQPSGEWREETDESKYRRILGPEKELRKLTEECV